MLPLCVSLVACKTVFAQGLLTVASRRSNRAAQQVRMTCPA
jgi:hypothetical protein